MQSIELAVVRDARFRSVDGFQIYGDGGTGVMDWSHPVTPRRLLFWEDALPFAPHLECGHLAGHHVDSILREGHLSGTHLMDRQGEPAGTTRFVAGPFVFGRFRHAVVPIDEIGNERTAGAVIHATTVNSWPPAASRFRAEQWDGVTGSLVFSFRGSERVLG